MGPILLIKLKGNRYCQWSYRERDTSSGATSKHICSVKLVEGYAYLWQPSMTTIHDNHIMKMTGKNYHGKTLILHQLIGMTSYNVIGPNMIKHDNLWSAD